MYPRNAEYPEPIAVGPVVQISDGVVQTVGVTVRVKPTGVDEADGSGILTFSTDGVVLYTPTQAETNYTSFILIAKKTGCIPVSVTIVTSARSISGEVQVGGYAVNANPLLTTDVRLDNLNAPVGDIPTNINLDPEGRVLLQPSQTGVTIPTVTNVIEPVVVGENLDKEGYTVTDEYVDQLVTAMLPAISDAIKAAVKGMTFEVKPETKVLGQCQQPIVQVPQQLSQQVKKIPPIIS